MGLEVNKISATEDLEAAFSIRKEVFVEGMGVDPHIENDQFEPTAIHFLARLNGKPIGTARWRKTTDGVKLERIAVREEARGQGIGQALVKAVLEDIDSDPKTARLKKYLHAQLKAVSLYDKFGFEKIGEMFEECNILHYTMELTNEK